MASRARWNDFARRSLETPDIGHFLKKVVARLTEHDDVIKHCSEGPRA